MKQGLHTLPVPARFDGVHFALEARELLEERAGVIGRVHLTLSIRGSTAKYTPRKGRCGMNRRGSSARGRRPSFLGLVLRAAVGIVLAFYIWVALSLILLRWVTPPTTAVQTERRVHAMLRHAAYKKAYTFVPLPEISPNLQHAVVAAEDARFYLHHGFDWNQVEIAVKDDLDRGRSRGASTITQQLVKNLFLGSNRSFVRKGVEFTIVPLTEGLLSKRRILELYLNVIEWGPGIYGAQAASMHYYGTTAKKVTREEAVGLAEVIPSPLRRRPGRLPGYGAAIEKRMQQASW